MKKFVTNYGMTLKKKKLQKNYPLFKNKIGREISNKNINYIHIIMPEFVSIFNKCL